MIERKLEAVIEDFNFIDEVWKKYAKENIFLNQKMGIDDFWAKIGDLIQDNTAYMQSENAKSDKEVKNEITDLLIKLKPTVFEAIYYLGIDYWHRKKIGDQEYNIKYIKRIIPPSLEIEQGESYNIALIYDRTRKNIQTYWKYLPSIYDETYGNPYLVREQKLQRGTDKFDIFLGNVIFFLKKIYGKDNIVFREQEQKDDTVKEKEAAEKRPGLKFDNVLSTISIILFETMPDFPGHKNTQYGKWTCERILDIDRTVKVYGEFPKLDYESTIEKLITDYAIEDLFYLDRISFALSEFFTFIENATPLCEETERKILLTFSLLIFLPSKEIQILELENIKMIARTILETQSEANENTNIAMVRLYTDLFIRSIIFPTVVSIAARYFLSNNGSPLELEQMGKQLKELEKYLQNIKNSSKGEKIWETDLFIDIKKKKNSNGREKKYRVLSSKCKSNMKFEEILKMMLNQKNGWKIRTLIEENRTKKSELNFDDPEMQKKNEWKGANKFVLNLMFGFLKDLCLIKTK